MARKSPPAKRSSKRMFDIEREALNRLLTEPMRIQMDGQTIVMPMLSVIMHRVWSQTLGGKNAAKARKIQAGFMSLLPKAERASKRINFVETEYTKSLAAKLDGDGDG